MESTSVLSQQHTGLSRWHFWLRWVVANALGFGYGFFLCAMILMQREGITDIGISLLVGLFGWTVIGLLVGIMQWIVLHPVLSNARWVVATVVGWAVGLGIGVALALAGIPPVLPYYLAAPGYGFAFGAGAGVLQALVLRCSIRRAVVWVLISAVGWAAGLPLLDPVQSVLITALGSYVRLFASGATVGGVSGMLTGLALVLLFRPGQQVA